MIYETNPLVNQLAISAIAAAVITAAISHPIAFEILEFVWLPTTPESLPMRRNIMINGGARSPFNIAEE